MINKECVACGNYFAGEWNGDYLCPACRAAGASHLRPLSNLDFSNGGRNSGPEPGQGNWHRKGQAA
ncbi:MAG: hypothetical protein ACRD1L_10350 [Terriglobales bacterium]